MALATACKVAADDLPSDKNAHFSAVAERLLRRGAVGAESRLTVSNCRLGKIRVEFAFGGDDQDSRRRLFGDTFARSKPRRAEGESRGVSGDGVGDKTDIPVLAQELSSNATLLLSRKEHDDRRHVEEAR